jgi:hypothetical protein
MCDDRKLVSAVRCRSWIGLSVGLLLTLVAVPPAQAQEACVSVTNLFPTTLPTSMSTGDLVTINVNARNTSRTAPSMVFVPGQVGGDTCVANVCRIGGGACATDANCTIDLKVQMACDSSTCVTPLPGTLTFSPQAGNGCLSSMPGVMSCFADPGDPDNSVIVRLAGGAANAIPIGANSEIVVAQIRAIATTPIPPAVDPNGFFFVRSESIGDFFITTSGLCLAPVTGSGEDTTIAQYQPVCEVKVDKQVSCDGGPFVDVGFDDNVVISCTAPQWGDIDVRYVVRNTGDQALFGCMVADSNPLIVAGALPAGNLLMNGDQVTLNEADQQCSDELTANEPDTATVVCDCEFPGSGTQVMDEDTASFQCEVKEGVCIPQ